MSSSLLSCVRDNSPTLHLGIPNIVDCENDKQQIDSTNVCPSEIENEKTLTETTPAANGPRDLLNFTEERRRWRFHPIRNLRRLFRRRTISSANVIDTPIGITYNHKTKSNFYSSAFLIGSAVSLTESHKNFPQSHSSCSNLSNWEMSTASRGLCPHYQYQPRCKQDKYLCKNSITTNKKIKITVQCETAQANSSAKQSNIFRCSEYGIQIKQSQSGLPNATFIDFHKLTSTTPKVNNGDETHHGNGPKSDLHDCCNNHENSATKHCEKHTINLPDRKYDHESHMSSPNGGGVSELYLRDEMNEMLQSEPLSHKAAKHKMSIRPMKRRIPSQLKQRNLREAEPKVEEEQPNAKEKYEAELVINHGGNNQCSQQIQHGSPATKPKNSFNFATKIEDNATHTSAHLKSRIASEKILETKSGSPMNTTTIPKNNHTKGKFILQNIEYKNNTINLSENHGLKNKYIAKSSANCQVRNEGKADLEHMPKRNSPKLPTKLSPKTKTCLNEPIRKCAQTLEKPSLSKPVKNPHTHMHKRPRSLNIEKYIDILQDKSTKDANRCPNGLHVEPKVAPGSAQSANATPELRRERSNIPEFMKIKLNHIDAALLNLPKDCEEQSLPLLLRHGSPIRNHPAVRSLLVCSEIDRSIGLRNDATAGNKNLKRSGEVRTPFAKQPSPSCNILRGSFRTSDITVVERNMAKTTSLSCPKLNIDDHTPELMKVFARRSLQGNEEKDYTDLPTFERPLVTKICKSNPSPHEAINPSGAALNREGLQLCTSENNKENMHNRRKIGVEEHDHEGVYGENDREGTCLPKTQSRNVFVEKERFDLRTSPSPASLIAQPTTISYRKIPQPINCNKTQVTAAEDTTTPELMRVFARLSRKSYQE